MLFFFVQTEIEQGNSCCLKSQRWSDMSQLQAADFYFCESHHCLHTLQHSAGSEDNLSLPIFSVMEP